MSEGNDLLVVYIGRFARTCGYSTAAKGNCDALRAVNIPVLMVDIDLNDVVGPPVGLLADVVKQNGRLVIRSRDEDARIVAIFHDTPDRYPQLDIDGRVRRIGLHLFETDSYPVHWFEKAVEMDEIWTASTFNQKTFAAAGIPAFMIDVVPHCLDVDLYGGNHSPMKVAGANGFMFLTVVSNYNRRDIGLLLRAYFAAFTADHDVTLVIKCFEQKGDPKYDHDFIASLVPELDINHPNLPKFIILNENFSSERMRSLYASCDVYVSVDRGKGWDYPAMEAMALGKPVIGIDWSGSTDFMTPENSILITPEPQNTPVDRELVTNFTSYIGHQWARVTDEAMQQALMRVYSDKNHRELIGKNARQTIKENYNFKVVGEIIKGKIEAYQPYHYYYNRKPQVILNPRPGGNVVKGVQNPGLKPQNSTVSGNSLANEDLRLILMVLKQGENPFKRFSTIYIDSSKFAERFSRINWEECRDRKLADYVNEFLLTHRKRINRKRKKFKYIYNYASKLYKKWKDREINIVNDIGSPGVKIAAPSQDLLDSYIEGTDIDKWIKRRKKIFSEYGPVPPVEHEITRLKSLKNKYLNQRIFIIGNGPSLNKIDFTKLKNEYTFGVNKIYLMSERIDWYPGFYTCTDWRVVPDDYKNINALRNGTIFFFPNRFKGLLREGEDVYWYFCRGGGKTLAHKFETDITRGVAGRGTVLVAAIQIAFYLGFRELYLIGVDADFVIKKDVIQTGRDQFGTGIKLELTSTSDDDPNHFDPRYFGSGAKWHDPNVNELIRGFIGCRKGVELNGGKLLNATCGGKLDVVERVDFNSLFPPGRGDLNEHSVSSRQNCR